MLVLTRKHDEQIMIGNNIIITVTAIQGNKVRIGIDAPQDIPVLRGEVYSSIPKKRQTAKLTVEKIGQSCILFKANS